MLFSLKMEMTTKNKDHGYWKECEEYKGIGDLVQLSGLVNYQIIIKENNQIKIKVVAPLGTAWVHTGRAKSHLDVRYLGSSMLGRQVSICGGFSFFVLNSGHSMMQYKKKLVRGRDYLSMHTRPPELWRHSHVFSGFPLISSHLPVHGYCILYVHICSWCLSPWSSWALSGSSWSK